MNCLAQRKKFKRKQPAWSETDQEDRQKHDTKKIKEIEFHESESNNDESDLSSDDDDDMYANDVRSKKMSLDTKNLHMKHVTNVNDERSYQGSVRQVIFNPKAKMALVTINSGQADIFEIDGERNRYLQNIKLPKTSRPFCAFKPDGNSIVISSEHYKGTIYTYDLVSSSIRINTLRFGKEPKEITDFTIYDRHVICRKEDSSEIVGLSSQSLEKIFSLKVNEPVKSIQFLNANEMFIAGYNANVYVYDVRKPSLCKHKFLDDGTVHITSLAVSGPSKLLSVGSDSGIVNTYELEECMTKKSPQPIHVFRNLVDPIDLLKYNPTGELLLASTQSTAGAFRMIHSFSGTVYKNFPAPGKKYGHLRDADFSPLGGYLSLGCSNGRAYLCRLPYYKSY